MSKSFNGSSSRPIERLRNDGTIDMFGLTYSWHQIMFATGSCIVSRHSPFLLVGLIPSVSVVSDR
jgi:hypothetical protein